VTRHRRTVEFLAALVTALSATTLAGCAGDYQGTTAKRPGADIETIAREATLRVRSIGCTSDRFGSGSAFVIDGDTLVTNRHVAEGTRRLQLSTWDGRDFEVRVGSISHLNDLAILRIDETIEDTLTRGPSIQKGQTVHAVGYPLGGAWTLTTGEVYDIIDGAEYDETGDIIRMTAGIQPGNSGGPLLDEEGRVVGVVFAIDTLSGLGLAISAERIDTLSRATTRVGTEESC
jgi:S1-C subfamily serine protease